MSRARTILSRFPAHFEADKPGKLLGAVTSALVRDLETQTAQVGDIRRAHRLREAFTTGDLMRLAALHGIRPGELALLDTRLDLVDALADALEAAAPSERDALIDSLIELVPLDLAEAPALPLADFVPPLAAGAAARTPQEEADAATTVLVSGLRAMAVPKARRAGLADRVQRIAMIHLGGNGTLSAAMQAAANALDLDVDLDRIEHSADRYWHAAPARDRLRPRPDPTLGLKDPGLLTDVIGIEENPLRRARLNPELRTHAERFNLVRKGFDPAPLEITVTAEATRTVGPMIVNRDQGRGVGFAGTVPVGATLTFTENGRALLNGSDVTARSFGFDGAVFAARGEDHPEDFRFDSARFVTVTPPGALDRAAAFPHAGPSLPMPEIDIGVTRMAAFLQEGHFSHRPLSAAPQLLPIDVALDHGDTSETLTETAPVFGAANPVTPTPRHKIGVFSGDMNSDRLGAVFAPGEDAADLAPSALVGFSWSEHQAYRARVILPARFIALDPDDNGGAVAERVGQALERVRPAGVTLEVAFIDDRWTLGESALPAAGGAVAPDLISQLKGGTVLWPAPAETEATVAPVEDPT